MPSKSSAIETRSPKSNAHYRQPFVRIFVELGKNQGCAGITWALAESRPLSECWVSVVAPNAKLKVVEAIMTKAEKVLHP